MKLPSTCTGECQYKVIGGQDAPFPYSPRTQKLGGRRHVLQVAAPGRQVFERARSGLALEAARPDVARHGEVHGRGVAAIRLAPREPLPLRR